MLAQHCAPDGGSPARSRAPASARAADPSLSGSVVDMGDAPYQHDTSNAPNFFVTLRAADGTEHTHWGVGLKQAVEQASVSLGDRVSVQRLGKQPVEVDRPVLDAMGDVSFTEREVVERQVWQVSPLVRSSASAPRSSDTLEREGVVGDPAFAKALALVEARMPHMSESARSELVRQFNVAHERLSRNRKRDSLVKPPSSEPVSRSARR